LVSLRFREEKFGRGRAILYRDKEKQ